MMGTSSSLAQNRKPHSAARSSRNLMRSQNTSGLRVSLASAGRSAAGCFSAVSFNSFLPDRSRMHDVLDLGLVLLVARGPAPDEEQVQPLRRSVDQPEV